MQNTTFTKASLVDAIYERIDRNKSEVKELVEDMLELMKSAIKKDHSLMLTGFGKFEVYQKPTRIGRNPKTAEESKNLNQNPEKAYFELFHALAPSIG